MVSLQPCREFGDVGSTISKAASQCKASAKQVQSQCKASAKPVQNHLPCWRQSAGGAHAASLQPQWAWRGWTETAADADSASHQAYAPCGPVPTEVWADLSGQPPPQQQQQKL